MMFIRSIRGEFLKKHFDTLDLFDIKYQVSRSDIKSDTYPKSAVFIIDEDDKYHSLVGNLSDAKNFYDKRANFKFTKQELQKYNYFSIRLGIPKIVELYDQKEICTNCFVPLPNKIDPFHFKNEPNLDGKFLFGVGFSSDRVLITDTARFKILNSKWGIKSKPIWIGKDKTLSTNYVALDINLAKSDLDFKDSSFGKIHNNCDKCNRKYYYGIALELFPNFCQNEDFDLCFTKEKFIPDLRHLIVSKEFVEFLVDYGMLNWGPYNLIPVKGSLLQT